MHYLFLSGPFLYWLGRAYCEYGHYLLQEIHQRIYRFIIATLLLVAHLVCVPYLLENYYHEAPYHPRVLFYHFFVVGIGYAFIGLSFVITSNTFNSLNERLVEGFKCVVGVLIITHYYLTLLLW